MNSIKLVALWEDNDTMLQVQLSVSNGALSTTQDFYIYPEELLELGKNIEEYFPSGGKGEILYEYGSEEGNFYSYVKFRVFYIDSGAIGIHIRTNNRKEEPELATSEFYLRTELQALNSFGKKLKSWAATREVPLEWSA